MTLSDELLAAASRLRRIGFSDEPDLMEQAAAAIAPRSHTWRCSGCGEFGDGIGSDHRCGQ